MVTLGYHEAMPLDTIQIAAGRNSRKTFDEDKLAELAESLRKDGVVEPLIARLVDGRVELVAGERRYRAAAIAGLAAVPVVVREYSDEQCAVVMLVENLKRAGVDACEEGAGYRRLIDEFGWTAARVAEEIGKKKRYVFQRMAMAESLSPEVREAVAKHEISANHAILLGRVKSRERQLEYLRQAPEMSVRDLDRWIKRDMLKMDAAPFDRASAGLVKTAGACDGCVKRTSTAPELWHDVKGDMCTDGGCWSAKVDAHVAGRLKAVKGLVQVGTGHAWPWPKGVLERGTYALVKAKKDACEHAVDAIVVVGDDRGAGVRVCVSAKCKKHTAAGGKASSGGYQRSEADKAKDRAEKLELEIARRVRGAVVDALLERGPKSVTVGLLEDVVERLWERTESDVRRLVRKRHPEWDADTIPVGGLDEAGLCRLALELALSGELWVMAWQAEKGVREELRTRCAAAGVDADAIAAAVRAEMTRPKAAKGKTLAEALAFDGVETVSKDGLTVEYRASKKGAVLARVKLSRQKRLVEKHAGAEADDSGWRVTVKVDAPRCWSVDGEEHADKGDVQATWSSRAAAEAAGYRAIVEASMGVAHRDADRVRDWAAHRLAGIVVPVVETAAVAGPALLTRQAAPAGIAVANEFNAYLPEACEVITIAGNGFEAKLFVARAAEDLWCSSWSASVHERSAGGLPGVEDGGYESREIALAWALDVLREWLGSLNGGKKQAAQVRQLLRWSAELAAIEGVADALAA